MKKFVQLAAHLAIPLPLTCCKTGRGRKCAAGKTSAKQEALTFVCGWPFVAGVTRGDRENCPDLRHSASNAQPSDKFCAPSRFQGIPCSGLRPSGCTLYAERISLIGGGTDQIKNKNAPLAQGTAARFEFDEEVIDFFFLNFT